MRLKWLLLGLLLVTACSKNTPLSEGPASVASYQNFSADQKAQIIESINSMNTAAGKILVETVPNQNGYPITLVQVEPPPESPNRAGFAIHDDTQCTIQISKTVFDPAKKDYVKSVLWHEMGHCFGLQHDPQNGQLMYYTAEPFKTYSNESINRFFTEITSSVKQKR
jgi:hypothetical protein